MPASPEKSWTTEQDFLLRDGWVGGSPVSEIALSTGRTETAVRGRVAVLGVKRSPGYIHELRSSQTSGRSNPNTRWSVEEEELLTDLYEGQGFTLSEISDRFPLKTQVAVRLKIRRLGLRHTKEQSKDAFRRTRLGEKNGMFGKPGPRRGVLVSDSTREKIRISAIEGFASGVRRRLSGPSNPMFGKPSTMRGRALPASAKKTLATKCLMRWAALNSEERAERVLKLRLGHMKWVNNATKITWIEKLVGGWLAGMGVQYGTQVLIGFYTVDFLIGDKVVETQGDYWHANPSVYTFLDATQKSNVRRDKAKKTYLTNRNFRLLELWEKDLKCSPDGCREVLRSFLG